MRNQGPAPPIIEVVTVRRAPLFVLALAVMGAQAGHLLAYQIRFGAAALRLESSGAHAYFPNLAKTGLGLAAAVVLTGLVATGLARVLGKRRSSTEVAAPSYLSLLAALYTIQLACFAGQETLEAAVAGVPASSAAVLLLWGTLGQLPIAAISAIALRWLLAEFDTAVAEIRAVLELKELRPKLVPVLLAVPAPAGESLLTARLSSASPRKRGPPSSLRISS